MPLSSSSPRFSPPITASSLHDAGQGDELLDHLSGQLIHSYSLLERQVAELNRQLAETRQARHRELAERERLAQQLNILLEAAPAAIVVVDRRDRIDRYNPAAMDFFPTLSWGRLWSEVCREGVLLTERDEWRLRDGRRISISSTSLDESGNLFIMMDVSETRELQDRVNRQERLAAMGEMAAQLAHQVRTPLSAAMLYAGRIAEGDLDPRQTAGFAEKLLSRLHHTEKLIADMLAFARGGRFVPQLVDLSRVVRDAADMIAPRFRDSEGAIEVHLEIEAAQVAGNHDALTGALGNLLENAVQHGGPGVVVQVGLGGEGAGHYLISISDSGPGIPEAIRDRIFEPFFTTRPRGTGLGLAVVHAVVTEHHGQISCHCGKEGGTTFRILLPRGDMQDVPATQREYQ